MTDKAPKGQRVDGRAFRPPFPPGHQINKTHGYYAPVDESEAAAVIGDLLSEVDIERYPVAALVMAECWIRWRRALADIDARGVVIIEDGRVKAHPLLAEVRGKERTLLDLVARFGLDPTSESALAKSRAETARTASDLDGLMSRGRAIREAREARSSPVVGNDDRPAVTEAHGGAEPVSGQCADQPEQQPKEIP